MRTITNEQMVNAINEFKQNLKTSIAEGHDVFSNRPDTKKIEDCKREIETLITELGADRELTTKKIMGIHGLKTLSDIIDVDEILYGFCDIRKYKELNVLNFRGKSIAYKILERIELENFEHGDLKNHEISTHLKNSYLSKLFPEISFSADSSTEVKMEVYIDHKRVWRKAKYSAYEIIEKKVGELMELKAAADRAEKEREQRKTNNEQIAIEWCNSNGWKFSIEYDTVHPSYNRREYKPYFQGSKSGVFARLIIIDGTCKISSLKINDDEKIEKILASGLL